MCSFNVVPVVEIVESTLIDGFLDNIGAHEPTVNPTLIPTAAPSDNADTLAAQGTTLHNE